MAAPVIHGILVGYDGSADGDRALVWAAEEALLRRTTLTVCTAWVPADPSFEIASANLARWPAERALSAGTAHARRLVGHEITVRPLLAYGRPEAVLRRYGAHADVIVLGSAGSAFFAKLMLGSVSAGLAAHARGRVVVLRAGVDPLGTPDPARGIVVGFDGSASAARALAWGFEEADLHGTGLTVVHAVPSGTVPEPRSPDDASLTTELLGPVPRTRDDTGAVSTVLGTVRTVPEAVGPAVRGLRVRYPGVPVEVDVTGAPPGRALLAASRGARLLLIGSRGLSGLHGVLRGSVGQEMLRAATCPVGVAHEPGLRDPA